jgi:phospholipase/carboxylesterase
VRLLATVSLFCLWSNLAPGGDLGSARLRARQTKPARQAQIGLHSLGLGTGRDGLISVPAGYKPGQRVPLIVMLHGARGHENSSQFCADAAKEGIAVLMPDSRGKNWDLITTGRFAPDIEFLDRALQKTFASVAVDPRRIALAGFSDGASYALSVGLANGDLFSHVIAYSPGFLTASVFHGRPALFIAHGYDDQVLSIIPARQIVTKLKAAGYPVEFNEFRGGHGIARDMARKSFRWLAGRTGPADSNRSPDLPLFESQPSRDQSGSP